MSAISVSEELVDYLKDKHTIEKVSSKKLCFNGSTINKSDLRGSLDLNELVSSGKLLGLLVLSDVEKRLTFNAAYERLLEISPYKRKALTGDDGVERKADHLEIMCWMRDGEKFVFDTANSEVSDISPTAFLLTMTRAEQAEHAECIPFMDKAYNPYDPVKVRDIVVSGLDVKVLNTYKPPTWFGNEDIPHPEEMPEAFSKFFGHLIPDPRVREFAYNWLHAAILTRNETILTINGVKGIGKGIFSEILKALVGKDNFQPAAVSSLDSDFNSMLENNRAIVFDEIEVTKAAHTKLKRYANVDQSIEKKGVDASKSTETFNSLVITNNDTSDMYIEVDDRRFSVLECTKTPLLQAMSKDEIDEIVDAVEDEALLGQLGNWLVDHGKCDKYDTFSVWKGPTFYKLAYTSLSAWQKHIVDECINAPDEEPIYYSSMKKAFKKDTNGNMPSNMSKVEDFLANYYHLGKYQVATLEKDDGAFCLVPSLDILGKTAFTAATQEMIDCL